MATDQPEQGEVTSPSPTPPASPAPTPGDPAASPEPDNFAEPGTGERDEADRLTTTELVNRLRDMLGAKLVAYLDSVHETRAVRQWADPADSRTPPDEVVNRLRMAYTVSALLLEKDSAGVVQAWFQGGNPLLDDVAPARLLREGNLDTAGPSVLAAARAFAANP